MISVAKSARTREVKFNHGLTKCKSAELASRYKNHRREPGIDVKIFSDHKRQDGNTAVGEIGNRAREGPSGVK